MERNEGKTDRLLRVVVGLVLIGLWALKDFRYELLALLIGLVLLITGITGFCGIYRLLGISTCREC
ncbi:YgaP family membrane protein [Thermococcus stetteri]|uniref:YgaP family membrane protein n=1 Tax=Thermococcus stetteri TaxID=49900 RepID=UPI001AE1CBEC|nr:DUF2892 domain-containing protein [Thermococcus stetteri]MBP1912815.1 uncharacterized membrane protein YuzA (DUF378 family) [Thermococcus stetteri]